MHVKHMYIVHMCYMHAHVHIYIYVYTYLYTHMRRFTDRRNNTHDINLPVWIFIGLFIYVFDE